MWAGLWIGIGLILMMSNLSINKKLWMTTNIVVTDIIVFILTLIIHGMIGGGVEGVLHASVAAGTVTIWLKWLRHEIGYWELAYKRVGNNIVRDPRNDEYKDGHINVWSQIK
jgi:hypothetical protein